MAKLLEARAGPAHVLARDSQGEEFTMRCGPSRSPKAVYALSPVCGWRRNPAEFNALAAEVADQSFNRSWK